MVSAGKVLVVVQTMKTISSDNSVANRADAASGQRSKRPAAATELVATHYTRTVHHDGNQYFAAAEMAEIFRANAERTVDEGDTELVPLLHSRGVDLLLITPRTVFAVVTIEVGTPEVA